MIRVSVYYPKGDGITFDMDYYKTKHRQICVDAFPDMKGMQIEQGIDGPYIAAGHLFFENMEQLQSNMGGPGAGSAQADLVNYTNSVPTLQISQVVTEK